MTCTAVGADELKFVIVQLIALVVIQRKIILPPVDGKVVGVTEKELITGKTTGGSSVDEIIVTDLVTGEVEPLEQVRVIVTGGFKLLKGSPVVLLTKTGIGMADPTFIIQKLAFVVAQRKMPLPPITGSAVGVAVNVVIVGGNVAALALSIKFRRKPPTSKTAEIIRVKEKAKLLVLVFKRIKLKEDCHLKFYHKLTSIYQFKSCVTGGYPSPSYSSLSPFFPSSFPIFSPHRPIHTLYARARK